MCHACGTEIVRTRIVEIMYNYSGIKPEIVELLSINRFNDSKEFYEEHKEQRHRE